MTDQQLRDLLEERVADLTMPDLSATAWRAGRRAERRRRLAVVVRARLRGPVLVRARSGGRAALGASERPAVGRALGVVRDAAGAAHDRRRAALRTFTS